MIASSTTETAQTPLAPFNDASGTQFWTSEGVKKTETFNYAYPETQKWAFSNDSDYTNSVQSAVLRLYGGATNDILGGQSLITAPDNVPVQAAKENVSNGHSSSSAQKPIAEQHPLAQDTQSTSQSHPTEHHHVREILDKAKGIFEHHSVEGESARGLDLVAEIGKGELASFLLRPRHTPNLLISHQLTQPNSNANTQQLQPSRSHHQKIAATPNTSAILEYPNTSSTKPSASTSSSGTSTAQQTPGTAKTRSSAPSSFSGATPSPRDAVNASLTPIAT